MSYDISGTELTYNSYNCLYGNTNCALTDKATLTKRKISDIVNIYNTKKNSADTTTATNAVTELANAYEALYIMISKSSDADNAGSLDKYHNNVKARRNDLDKKLATNNKLSDSLYGEMQSHYESTLMAGVLWGTLAGTMIYYVFYK